MTSKHIRHDRPEGSKPKFMITYLCPHCGFDSGRTELDEPWCFICERSDGLVEIKREKMTKEVLFARMARSMERMTKSLEQAYNIREADWPQNPEEETMLLEAMAKGQQLKETLAEIGRSRGKAKPPMKHRKKS